MSTKKVGLAEIASRIGQHLRRFEKDAQINKKDDRGLSPYWNVFAHRNGRYVQVQYVSYQGHSSLTRAEAEKYLAWLDAGNVGRHYSVPAQTKGEL